MKHFERPRKKSNRIFATINNKYLTYLNKVLDCYKTHPLYNQATLESFSAVSLANKYLQAEQINAILKRKYPVLEGTDSLMGL